MLELFYREYGAGEPIIILHGLFGSADNWMTQAKMLSESYHVYTVDQRNHGLSPHSPDHDYDVMAEDLRKFLNDRNIDDAIIVGHSMGGKTAMNFAIRYPGKVKKLIVVDIVPKSYPVHHDTIIDGLKALPIRELKSRNEADEKLSHYIAEPAVRQFLLKNLSREQGGGFSWKMNLTVLDQSIEEISAGMVANGSYAGPTLFIFGSRSSYYSAGDEKIIDKYFPNSKLEFIDSGHWAQAEKPQEFVEIVTKFLAKD